MKEDMIIDNNNVEDETKLSQEGKEFNHMLRSGLLLSHEIYDQTCHGSTWLSIL